MKSKVCGLERTARASVAMRYNINAIKSWMESEMRTENQLEPEINGFTPT